jgi:DNA mismatch endonuclease (patch repair protein)
MIFSLAEVAGATVTPFVVMLFLSCDTIRGPGSINHRKSRSNTFPRVCFCDSLQNRMGNSGESPPYTGDTLTAKQRSQRMAKVKNKDTKPELFVRSLLSSMGYRYRLHLRSVPGSPDIVFSHRKKVIFVHGCFWHRHKGCANCRLPKSKLEFWKPKLDGNAKRDARTRRELRRAGWQFLVVWECELKSAQLPQSLKSFLEAEV